MGTTNPKWPIPPDRNRPWKRNAIPFATILYVNPLLWARLSLRISVLMTICPTLWPNQLPASNAADSSGAHCMTCTMIIQLNSQTRARPPDWHLTDASHPTDLEGTEEIWPGGGSQRLGPRTDRGDRGRTANRIVKNRKVLGKGSERVIPSYVGLQYTGKRSNKRRVSGMCHAHAWCQNPSASLSTLLPLP